MDRARNDATLKKVGDIFQYYIALRDCFKMNTDDKLRIETDGDVSLISELSGNSFQREVKHHVGDKNLSDRDVDFWKTLSNWYVEYDRIESFSAFILHTTADILAESSFYSWNNKSISEKLNILQSIGKIQKNKEETFRKHYNKIFVTENYNEDKLSKILEKFTIEYSQNKISGISKEFSVYVGYIPEVNRDNYIGAILGRIIAKIKDPPYRWEVTREEFDKILQQETPAHWTPNTRPLPDDFAKEKISEEDTKSLMYKNFVKAIEDIEYKSKIPSAISDYWKAEMTIMRYFRDDFSYNNSLEQYGYELKHKMQCLKDNNILENEKANKIDKIKYSKIMYNDIMGWDAKNFGSIVRNQGYFQRGIIHSIVDDKEFNWYIGETDEY